MIKINYIIELHPSKIKIKYIVDIQPNNDKKNRQYIFTT